MPHIFLGSSQPIKQGDRKLQTNISGLTIATQSYIVRKSELSSALAKFKLDSPDPDGSGFLFPNPEVQMREDGFATISCTYYGIANGRNERPYIERGREEGRIRVGKIQTTTIATPGTPDQPGTLASIGTGVGNFIIAAIVPTLRYVYVKPADSPYLSFNPSDPLIESIVTTDPRYINTDIRTTTFERLSSKWLIIGTEETNYGKFTEVTQTFKFGET